MLPEFIHPLEKTRFAALNKNPTLGNILNVLGGLRAKVTSLAEIPDRSFAVTSKTFPHLYEIYQKAHDRLELDKNYDLFCTMNYGRNAKTLGTDDDCLIVMDSSCLEDFSDKQIFALLGRELGHIKLKHIKYHTTLKLIENLLIFLPDFLYKVANAAAINVLRGLFIDWLLVAEFSADRAGAIAAGEILPVVQNNLMICGLETATECIDFESYMQADLKQNINNFDQATKLLMTETLRDFPIPFVIPRIKELVKWSISKDCIENFPEVYHATKTTDEIKNSETRTSIPTLTLFKGQRFDLTKNNPQLIEVIVNFEWEQTTLDIEHGVFLLSDNGKVDKDEDFLYYNNPSNSSESVICSPHEKNFAKIKINLKKIPDTVKKIALVLMIYDAENHGQNFSMIKNISLKLSDGNNDMATFYLERFTVETVIIGGEIYRNKGVWKFNPIGSGWSGGIKLLCKNYGVNIEEN